MADDVNRGSGIAGNGSRGDRYETAGPVGDETGMRPPAPSDPWAGLKPASPAEAAPTTLAKVELIGSGLRAEGMVNLGRFARVTDYVNLLSGYFTIEEVTLLNRQGERSRVRFPDLRVRLADIAIVGRRELEPAPEEPASVIAILEIGSHSHLETGSISLVFPHCRAETGGE